MGSPAYFGRLANFQASLRKPGLIPFGLFNVQDNLNFLADMPAGATISRALSQASQAYASSLAIDTSAASVITILLTGNVSSTVLNYAGSATIPPGTFLWIRFQQDATGGWTVALPANLVTDPGFAVDPTALRTTVIPIQWNAVNSRWIFTETPFSVPGT